MPQPDLQQTRARAEKTLNGPDLYLDPEKKADFGNDGTSAATRASEENGIAGCQLQSCDYGR
jgi:hypothetical protein